jgi:hypothetical protein
VWKEGLGRDSTATGDDTPAGTPDLLVDAIEFREEREVLPVGDQCQVNL